MLKPLREQIIEDQEQETLPTDHLLPDLELLAPKKVEHGNATQHDSDAPTSGTNKTSLTLPMLKPLREQIIEDQEREILPADHLFPDLGITCSSKRWNTVTPQSATKTYKIWTLAPQKNKTTEAPKQGLVQEKHRLSKVGGLALRAMTPSIDKMRPLDKTASARGKAKQHRSLAPAEKQNNTEPHSAKPEPSPGEASVV